MKNWIIVFLTFSFLSFLYAQEKIVLSTIYTKEIEGKYEKFALLANYLENNNKNNLRFDIKLFKSVDNVIKAINSNQVHIFIDSFYATKLIQNNTDVIMSSKNWKNGEKGYKSIIFVKKDSLIQNLEDLKDKTIVFEDKYSTSAYFIPRRILEKKGLKLSNVKLNSKIKYVFALSEENIVAKVFFNHVDAGALDNKTFEQVNKGEFKVLYESELLPRSILSFSNLVSQEDKNEILKVLFNMEFSSEGKKVLKNFEKSSRFSTLSIEELEFLKSL